MARSIRLHAAIREAGCSNCLRCANPPHQVKQYGAAKADIVMFTANDRCRGKRYGIGQRAHAVNCVRQRFTGGSADGFSAKSFAARRASNWACIQPMNRDLAVFWASPPPIG